MASLETVDKILAAARTRLLADGFAALSTRKVAEEAGVPLSQIHYHFGSKDELILDMLRAENETLLQRQAEMFGRDLPLWKRWDIACDYLDEDLKSGYVRVLHEMMAVGWSSELVGKEVRTMILGWNRVLTELAASAEAQGLRLEPFTAAEIAALTGAAFVGAESMILLGLDSQLMPLRNALRQIGKLIKSIEKESK